jgi:cell wall-associated NlpC family hydrolase
MPRVELKRQDNGSLTGVKQAGEGGQGVGLNDTVSAVTASTDVFGQGAFNAASPESGEPTFGEIWGQIDPKTSFDERVQGGETTLSTDVQGGSPSEGGGKGNSSLVNFAKRFLGTPYKWGGNTPSGFDCSGFTRYVLGEYGVSLPRVSYQQGQGGKAVASNDLRPGDLVFWDNSSRNVGADHVGIYIGNGQYIHSPQPGSSVKISSLGGNYWARRYLSGSPASSGGSNTRQRAV